MDNQEKKVVKSLQGHVISDAMDKSIVIQVVYKIKHKFGKYMKKNVKIMAHDENNQAKVGDEVIICEGRKRSARKSWQLVTVLTEA